MRLPILFLISALATGSAFGAEPSAPATTTANAPSDLFQPDSICLRNFIYKNRAHPVDSSRKLDGEGLRFVLKNNGQAQAMLNEYQTRLKSSRWPAYTSTFGVLVVLVGVSKIGIKNIDSDLGRRDTQRIVVGAGSILALGSYFYGQWMWGSKEKVLEKAVQTYNDSAPEKERITVNFEPVQVGTGGQVNTIVPF